MKENIEQSIKQWDWRSQSVWDLEVKVSSILSRIEAWYYQTKEVEIDLEVFNLASYRFKTEDLFDFITHYKLVEKAELKYPVIVNMRGEIIDWRHRLCKAIIKGEKKLKAIMIINSNICY